MSQKTTPATASLARLKWSGCTDRGKVRSSNEDSYLGLQFDSKEVHRLGKFGEATIGQTNLIFAVSDGMGGTRAGEFASHIAVEKITALLPRAFKQSTDDLKNDFADVLAELYAQIHRALLFVGDSYDECKGMETTLSLCWFTTGWMFFGHIGDSRIYHLPARKGGIHQLTHDDTHVGWLFRQGKLTEREARAHPRRTVLQKALGGGNQFVSPQVGAVACESGDRFLLCTDGLVEGVYDSQLLDLLRPTMPRPTGAETARELVATAVVNSGRDNTTALVVEVA